MDSAIECSIVLAVLPGAPAGALRVSVDALRAASSDLHTELILVASTGSDELDAPTSGIPGFTRSRVEKVDVKTLTPDMWGVGLRVATGRTVMFTTSQLVVNKNALVVMARAVAGEVAGVGGAISPGLFRGPVADASCFVRFSSFLPGLWPRQAYVRDIPGDNSMYLRSALVARVEPASGFWEVAYHRALERAGLKLSMLPEAVAEFSGGSAYVRTLQQRYAHGVKFGGTRVTDYGEHSLRVIAAAPLVPAILLARIGRRVLSSRTSTWRFLASVPWIVPLLIMWAAGEAVGAMRAHDIRTAIAT